MESTLVELFKHNLWANLRLLDVCAKLTQEQLEATAPGTYGRVRDTLLHILGAEERYMIYLTEKQPEDPLRTDDGFPSFAELRQRANHTGDGLVRIAESIQPTQVLRGTRRGKPYAINAVILLIQAINHATEHRGHVVSIISQSITAPIALDGWAYGEALGVVERGA